MVRQRFGMTVSTGALSVRNPLPDSGTRRCGLCGAGLEVLFVFTKMLEEPQVARAISIVLLLGMEPGALVRTR